MLEAEQRVQTAGVGHSLLERVQEKAVAHWECADPRELERRFCVLTFGLPTTVLLFEILFVASFPVNPHYLLKQKDFLKNTNLNSLSKFSKLLNQKIGELCALFKSLNICTWWINKYAYFLRGKRRSFWPTACNGWPSSSLTDRAGTPAALVSVPPLHPFGVTQKP